VQLLFKRACAVPQLKHQVDQVVGFGEHTGDRIDGEALGAQTDHSGPGDELAGEVVG
jgi:hypothetical protein